MSTGNLTPPPSPAVVLTGTTNPISSTGNEQKTLFFGMAFPNFAVNPIPLSPLVMAECKEDGTINVSSFVFLPSTDAETVSFQIYIDPVTGGDTQLIIYISSDNSPEVWNNQVPYEVNFSIDGTAFNPNKTVTDLKVYVWDEDPEGSRGTETSVLKPA